MCLYPRLMMNPKYRKNKKNGGVVPAVSDKRVLYVPIGCGSCIECRKQKANNWLVRLNEDVKDFKNGKFVTLTFSTESLQKIYNADENLQKLKGYDLDNGILIYAVRHFLERWRKKYGKSLRHWLVSELGHGKTEHVHLHDIVWCDDMNEVEKIWGYGFVWKGYEVNGKFNNYVNGKTVGYIVKYITKLDLDHLNYKSLVLCSPGIGKGYVKKGFIENKFNEDRTNEGYRKDNGFKVGLPIYYRNKFYSDSQRERLWLLKLDKNERFVCGEKISVMNDDKEYNNLVMYHRRRSESLGYPPPDFIWKKSEYEKIRREMLHDSRIRVSEEKKNKNNKKKSED